jgi:hypothetical protein
MAIMIVLALAILFGVRLGSPRVLASSQLPDGREIRIVGKPRLFGILGIEIVDYEVMHDGREQAISVNDLCGSWDEAERKYANPTGGGLLPISQRNDTQIPAAVRR